MPRPFQFAASFLSGGNSDPSNTSSPDIDSVRCKPNLKFRPPLPLQKRTNSPVRRRMSQCAQSHGGVCICIAPVELLVLSHGLQGDVADFSYLLDELSASGPALSGGLLVHATAVNTDRTHDGIIAGGERLAADIRIVVARHPTLRSISLVGFSLGGLYVRYAAALLYADRLIAGLVPARFVTVASPNLGVRNFGVYRFFPQPVRILSNFFIGVTGLHLFLEDEGSLLLRMSKDDSEEGGLKFVTALKSFSKRVLYANTKNDFMVNYGTAALDEDVQVLSAYDLQAIIESPKGRDVEHIDLDYDDKGCKVSFTFQYDATDYVGENALANAGMDEETIMARRLRAIGWTVVAVDFPVALPIAHNRIVAMSRGPIHTWLNAAGRRVVHHLVDTLMDGFEEAHPRFERVASQLPRRSLSLRGFVYDI